MCNTLSHTAVLLPRFVHHGGLWRVERRGQCAQETSQQRKAQSSPCAKHGPAITMTDVLWYAKHVAGIAGQFKVDPSHTCAKRDYAACPCQREWNLSQSQQQPQFISWQASFHRRLINKDLTAPQWWLGVVLFMWSTSYLPWGKGVRRHTASDHAPYSSPARQWPSRTGWWK